MNENSRKNNNSSLIIKTYKDNLMKARRIARELIARAAEQSAGNEKQPGDRSQDRKEDNLCVR